MPRIRPSRGTHVILSRESLAVDAGVIVPAAGGRTVFVLPWLGRTLVGTTDNDYEARDLDHVPASGDDVEYLLDAVNSFFATDLGSDDLAGAYAGVRPLISTGDPKKSVDISRRAELYETSSGLVTITGGKLTTWRRMAKMAVDRLVEREGREAPCRTHEIPLGLPVDPADLPAVPGVDDAQPRSPGRPLRPRRARGDGAGGGRPGARRAAEPRPARTWPPRRPSPRGASRCGRSRTCCCGAPAWASSTRARCRRRERTAPSAPRAPWPGSSAGATSGCSPSWRDGARWPRAEGLVPGAAGGGARGAGGGGVSADRLSLRGGVLALEQPVLMGIVNATPDSFSDVQRPKELDELVELAERLAADGAEIIDVGGESGRTDRPVVAGRGGGRGASCRSSSGSRASASRSRSTPGARPVARAALDAGAAMINDVSGLSDASSGRCVRRGRRRARGHPHAVGAQAEGVSRLRRRGRRRALLPRRARRGGSRARRGRRGDRARPRRGPRQDARRVGRGAPAPRRGAGRSAGRCCSRSRARTSSA